MLGMSLRDYVFVGATLVGLGVSGCGMFDKEYVSVSDHKIKDKIMYNEVREMVNDSKYEPSRRVDWALKALGDEELAKKIVMNRGVWDDPNGRVRKMQEVDKEISGK